MNNRSNKSTGRERGVTLIELMIVVVIVAILASLAYPSYLRQAQRAGRTDATSALLAIAAAQEKEFLKNNAYTASLTDLGITQTDANKYDLTLSASDGGFLAVAEPSANGNQSQQGDVGCTEFSIDHTGAKKSKGTSSNDDGSLTVASSLNCW